MSTQLSLADPLAKRFWGWMSERYAPANWLLFFVLYAAALLCGRLLASGGVIGIGPRDLVGFVAAWSFFLMLRVFDEHKDYALDCKLHPDRVLQRGLITLGHLKVVGALAIAAQIAVSLWADSGSGFRPGTVTWLWLLVMAWSTLMAKEFFVGEWLKKRLVLYALSHMLVTPMALIWMAQMGGGQDLLPAGILWLALLSFLSGATFEVTRKTWGPEEEREGLDSYARVLGVTRAPVVIMILLTAAAAVQAILLARLLQEPAWVWFLLVGAVLVLPFWALLRFRAQPSAAARKRNEAAVGLAMMLGYLILLAALVAEQGVAWM